MQNLTPSLAANGKSAAHITQGGARERALGLARCPVTLRGEGVREEKREAEKEENAARKGIDAVFRVPVSRESDWKKT